MLPTSDGYRRCMGYRSLAFPSYLLDLGGVIVVVLVYVAARGKGYPGATGLKYLQKTRNHISRKRDRVQSTWPSAQNLPRVIPRYTLLPRPGTRRQRSRGPGSVVVLCVRLLPRALKFTMSRGVEARNVIHRAPL
ncbi:hypothetical protein LZ31DRAFT_353285 [Colletotrichum somersetense]|nr:hypothetical protein LZ31DRAFT_353285 [Colletotrichum somersetense]